MFIPCQIQAKSQGLFLSFFVVQSLIKFSTEKRNLCHWKLDCLHYAKPHRWGMVKNPVPPMRQHIRQCVGQRSADYGSRQWLMTISKIYITCRLCVSGVSLMCWCAAYLTHTFSTLFIRVVVLLAAKLAFKTYSHVYICSVLEIIHVCVQCDLAF